MIRVRGLVSGSVLLLPLPWACAPPFGSVDQNAKVTETILWRGTVGYIAPELRGPGSGPPIQPCDIWSMGATIAAVIPKEEQPKELQALLGRMCSSTPSERPTASEVLGDAYFTSSLFERRREDERTCNICFEARAAHSRADHESEARNRSVAAPRVKARTWSHVSGFAHLQVKMRSEGTSCGDAQGDGDAQGAPPASEHFVCKDCLEHYAQTELDNVLENDELLQARPRGSPSLPKDICSPQALCAPPRSPTIGRRSS